MALWRIEEYSFDRMHPLFPLIPMNPSELLKNVLTLNVLCCVWGEKGKKQCDESENIKKNKKS